MKRFVVVFVVACSGGDKKVADPVQPSDPPRAVSVSTRPAPPQDGPPVARIENVREMHHGVAVDDPYRWLESESAEAKQWSAGQNAYARKILDGLPDLETLRAELTAIFKAPITRYGGLQSAGGKLFAMRRSPTKEQPELIVTDDPAKIADARVIVDPSAGNALRTIDWYVPSPDGSKVAVSLSEKGSEAGDVHVYDLDGKLLEPATPNVQRGTGGGSVAWTPDGKGFYYTRYPSASEKPEGERDFWMQLWFHALGSEPGKDRYELGKDFPRIAEIQLEIDPRGRVLAKIQNGDSGQFRHYLRDGNTWRQFGDWTDGVVYIGFGSTADLWMISRANAPRGALYRLPAKAKSIADAKVVVPQGKDAIHTDYYSDRGVLDTGDRVYLTYEVGGPVELRAFTRDGKPAKAPELPPIATSWHPVKWKKGVLVAASSYTTPSAWYWFDGKATSVVQALSPKSPVDLSGLEVIRDHAVSKDGTKVPFTVLWPKGKPRDGSVACVVSGYGGFGVSETPHYQEGFSPLLKRGICLVETNLRGGSEFGQEWHHAGRLTKKQNVFDDFAAVLRTVAEKKYTSAAKLAILGGSNGGLLVGALITQQPQLVKAAVGLVGIYDMIRSELTANGAFVTTEYGSVKDKAQFEALFAYSPYHRVKPNTRYPAVLLTAGENDPRVASWHSRKMTAALQAAQAGDAPILYRTSTTAGHGMGTALTERIDDAAQMMAFLLWQLR